MAAILRAKVRRAIAGLIPVHSGSIHFRGEELAGQNAFAIVRKGLALSPEGWRLFVQQSVEKNLLLGATPLSDKSRIAHLLEQIPYQEVPYRPVELPPRVRNPDYHRGPTPPEMYVPERY